MAIHKSDAAKQRAMLERETKVCEAQKQVRGRFTTMSAN